MRERGEPGGPLISICTCTSFAHIRTHELQGYACISNVDETSLLTDADLVQLQALEIDPFDLQNHIKLGYCVTSILVIVRGSDQRWARV